MIELVKPGTGISADEESQRLACLRAYRLQENVAEDKAYIDLVKLAAQLCEMPVAFVSFLDEKQQWIKAAEGIDLFETSRQVAFCEHIIQQQDFLLIEDACQDPRFAENPFVVGIPFIRFYAGAPIRSREGHILGALAVVDFEPREFSKQQKDGLERLAHQVEHILELRRGQLELESAKKEVEDQEKKKSRFFAQISHDLRTPLNGVLGMLEVLQRGNLSEEQQEGVDTIRYSAEQLLRLVNDLLDFQKLDAGKLQIENRPFLLGDLLAPLQRTFQWQANQKQLKFRISEPLSLPALTGDAHRLGQVLMNLLSNAFKFTKNGEVSLSIEPVELADEYVKLSFCVEDTGIGIDEESQRSLFHDFTQANTSIARRYGGTGLGLAIVKELVQLMGGAIQLESEPGRGSKFSFDLNFPVSQEAKLVAQSELLLADYQNQPKYVGNILVVDDNPVNCLVVRRLLEHAGLLIDTAEDGLQALESIKKVNYDLVLMDLEMPGMDGFQATRAIRQLTEGEQLPVYALTAAVSSVQERKKFKQAGFNGILTKPLQFAQLQALLENHLPVADEQPVIQLMHALKELAEVDQIFQQELVRTARQDFKAMITDLGGAKGSDAEFIRKLRHKYKATFQLFSLQLLDDALKKLQLTLEAEEETENSVTKLKKQIQEIGEQALLSLESFL